MNIINYLLNLNLTFISVYFVAFAVVAIAAYHLVPKNKWIVLLVASILFYLTWGIEKLPFILVSALIAFIAAKKMSDRWKECDERIENLQGVPDSKAEIKKIKAEAKKSNKTILIIAIVLLLLMLLYVKVGKLLVNALSMQGVSIIVPLGISYYTFSLIGYLADCYWKKDEAEENYFKLLLFASYFPKILQGPISRHNYLASQLLKDNEFKYENVTSGLQLMLWGYFKKMVIADRLVIFVNTVFNNYQEKSGSMLIVGALFGAFQLYCDFSGCMDIACGFSETIGIKLDRNFERPFFSESAPGFWRRWHMTLSAWFKDYVYIPLTVSPALKKIFKVSKKKFGADAAKKIITIIPLLVVWLLTGLWHGTGLNYLVWGAYWAMLMCGSILLEPAFARLADFFKINTDSKAWHVFRRVRTFGIFLFSRLITLPKDMPSSIAIIKTIFTSFNAVELINGTLFDQGLDKRNIIIAAVFLIVLYLVSSYEEKNGSVRAWIAERPIVLRWAIYYGLIFSIMIYGIYGTGYDTSGFVYMNF